MPIGFDLHDGVATVTLNRPEAMNALDPESVEQLQAACLEISRNGSVRAVVLTAAGDRAFCTGADLKKTMPPPETFAELHYGSRAFAPALWNMRFDKPTIAAINGYALGGGLELALMCDVRIASTNATFGLPEVCIGSIPGAGGTQRLVRSIGQSDAMLMLMTGERISADEALRIGLISRIVPSGELRDAAHSLASKIASNAPLAVAAVRRLATMGRELPLSHGLELEQQAFGVLRSSTDRMEGRVAFAQKRKPQFKGQ